MNTMPSDVQMATIPVSHAYGLGNLIMPAAAAGNAARAARFVRPSAAPDATPAVTRARLFQGVPFMFQFFLSCAIDRRMAAVPDLADVRRCSLPPEIGPRVSTSRFALKIHSFYGSSEAGGIAFDAGDEIDDSGTVGRPAARRHGDAEDQEDVNGTDPRGQQRVANGYADEAR